MRLENISINEDLFDGFTERRLMLAEVEPLNGFWRLVHRCWPPLPTYRYSCDAGSDDLWEGYAIRFAPCQ